jgi:hypothetical protein
MSDDFGTINVSRGERAREIEVQRERMRRHRETLESLIADAPDERFGQHYARLIRELDAASAKLAELEGGPAGPPPPDRLRAAATEPAMRPLITTPQHDDAALADRRPGEPVWRILLILAAAFAGLAFLGWLIWRASHRGEGDRPPAVEATTTTMSTATTETSAATSPPPQIAGLVVSPPEQNFGVVRKGTRVVRKFTLRNETDEPVSIKVARSACRCLYYQYAPVIPPKNQETLTVTIDGAKAKAGELRESLPIASGDPSVSATVTVTATVR